MKFFIMVILCCFQLIEIVTARTWTDKSGRTIEAEIVTADANSVTVLMNGKEVVIQREKLSEEDKKFCDEWIEKKNAEQKEDQPAQNTNTGEITFDGKPLVAGGKVNVYNYDYSPERLKTLKKFLKDGETGFRIGLAVPKGFDPSKPQKVFVANTAQNNAKQTLQGNTAMAGFFSKQCAQEGWVCFAFDSNLGRPKHNGDMMYAFAKLAEVWPQSKNWTYVVGGFSGGGKAAFWPTAYLIKCEYKVIGLFLANTNEDFSDEARKQYKIKKSDYKNVSVFWGTGKWDKIANEEKGNEMKKSLERNGMKEVRVELHDGKHSLYHPQFIEALQWFATKG